MAVPAEPLDERKAAILKAIVRDYVREGEPVGSKRLVEAWSFGVSAATIRNEMAALEDGGFIAQPHTSAGRVPTDKGYRYFVDTLDDAPAMQPELQAALEGLLLGSRDLEELLRRASAALSRFTRHAALVVAPSIDRSRLRHIELVQLGPTSILAIFIADTGRVEKRMLDLDAPVAEHDVQRARHAVNEAAGGLRASQAPDLITGMAAGAPPELRGLLEAVAESARGGLEQPKGEHVIVGGTANIAARGNVERIEQLREVFELLEEQVVLLGMLHEALASGDPAIRIGAELAQELAAFSIVAAGYDVSGASGGSVGVLGPVRMDYPRTLAVVQTVASALEQALAEQTGGAE